MPPIARRRLITKWNVLALLVVVAGTAATLLGSRLYLQAWVDGGTKFAISAVRDDYNEVDLPAGDILVYYESNESVPTGRVILFMRAPGGDPVEVGWPADDNSFEIGGRQGRAIFSLHITEPGRHIFRCSNANYLSDNDVPAGDRIAFLKDPPTLAPVLRSRRMILLVGASITLGLAVLLYVCHVVALYREDRVVARTRPAFGAQMP